MADIDPDIIEAWDRMNKARLRPRNTPFVAPYAADAPKDRPPAADEPTSPAATIWNKMRGAGVNVERGAGWGDVDWQCLVDTGNAWVRLFYPFRPDREMNGPGSDKPPSESDLLRLVRGAEAAIEAGIPVVAIEATDVIDVSTAQNYTQVLEDHIRKLARLVKTSSVLNPGNCCFGPVNEYAAGNSDAEWKPFRDRFNAATREELPGWALTTGGFYWKSLFDVLTIDDPAPPGDPEWIVDAHQYEQSSDWSEIADQMRAWMHAHNRLLFIGEIGPYNPNWEWLPREAWEERYRAQGPIWSVSPLAPWATTYGSGLPVNTYGKLDVDPMFHDLWLDHEAVQATRPAIAGGGDGGTDPPPQPTEKYLRATLAARDDYNLEIDVEASSAPQMIVVENHTYAWRGQPVTVQPGRVQARLTEPTDFVKFMLKGCDPVDVPHPDEAADYEPDGGVDPEEPPPGGEYTEADVQRAFQDGYQAGWDALEEKAAEEFGDRLEDIEQPPPPDYITGAKPK